MILVKKAVTGLNHWVPQIGRIKPSYSWGKRCHWQSYCLFGAGENENQNHLPLRLKPHFY